MAAIPSIIKGLKNIEKYVQSGCTSNKLRIVDGRIKMMGRCDKQCNNERGQGSGIYCPQGSEKKTIVESGNIYKCNTCSVCINGQGRFQGNLLSDEHIDKVMLKRSQDERLYCTFCKRFFSLEPFNWKNRLNKSLKHERNVEIRGRFEKLTYINPFLDLEIIIIIYHH